MEQKHTPRPKGNYSTYRRFAYYLKDPVMPSQSLMAGEISCSMGKRVVGSCPVYF